MVECHPSEPLSRSEALKAARQCLVKGSLLISKLARARMEEHDLVETDIVNTIRYGRLRNEPWDGTFGWCYCIETEWMAVDVAFGPKGAEIEEVILVTAWRNRRRGK